MKSFLPYFVYSINSTSGQLTFDRWENVKESLIRGFITFCGSFTLAFVFLSGVLFFVLLAWEVLDSYFFGNTNKGDNLIGGVDDEEY